MAIAARIPSSAYPGGIRTSTTATSGWCSRIATEKVFAVGDGGYHLMSPVDQDLDKAPSDDGGIFGDRDSHSSLSWFRSGMAVRH